MKRTVIQRIASLIVARNNCIASGNTEWSSNHSASLEEIAKHFLPSGSGFDSGCTIDVDSPHLELWDNDDNPHHIPQVIIHASYHHMDEHGYYCGWSDHTFTIRPTFDGFDIDVDSDYSHVDMVSIDEETGEEFDSLDEADTDDYLCDAMHHHISREIVQTADGFDYVRDEEGNIVW